MTSEEKILKAKVQLILNHPFFATLALRMKYTSNISTKTATTDGIQIKYNPSYIDSLTIEQTTGVLAHEVMHTALLHHTRRNHRDLGKWNRAADYSINPLLITAGFILPEDFLLNDEYSNKSTDQIYNLLEGALPEENNNGGTGDIEDPPSETDVQELEAQMKQTVAQAVMMAKRQGNLPDSIERLIDNILKPKVNWHEQLARYIAEITKNDYTWKRPSPRYLYSGLYLPTLESEQFGSLILIVDTSGSIDTEILNQVGSETHEIARTFNIPLKVIYVDVKVQAIQDIEPDEPLELKPAGGGGTDFIPGFEYIEANDLQPKAVLYLTDGDCDRFPPAPDYPVLWAKFGEYEFDPPFGETVEIL